jgi:hypothetical protein
VIAVDGGSNRMIVSLYPISAQAYFWSMVHFGAAWRVEPEMLTIPTRTPPGAREQMDHATKDCRMNAMIRRPPSL